MAVTIAAWGKALRWPFLLISLVFVYTTALNVYERPEGIKIASLFIISMVATSLLSRALRSTELRILAIELDQQALALLAEDDDGVIRLIARKPRSEADAGLDEADRLCRECHGVDIGEKLYFFEVNAVTLRSLETLQVTGERVGGHWCPAGKEPVVCECDCRVSD